MSAVNLCERCDTLMLGKAVALLTLQLPDQRKEMEICPGCVQDLQEFMTTPATVGSRPKTYRQPYANEFLLRDERSETPAITE